MTLEVVRLADREILARLFQLYRHDSSEFDDEEPDGSGLFSLGTYFEQYWLEPERYPYFICDAGCRAGFALVREVGPGVHAIAEFFVLRGSRRRGIGRAAARAVFERHRGQWRVAQDERNLCAQRFWRRVIDQITGGDFAETRSPAQPRGPEQRFDNGLADSTV